MQREACCIVRPLRLEWPAFSGRPRPRPWPQRPRSPPPSLPSSQPRRLNDESWPIPHALGRATLTQLPVCRCHGPEQVFCVTVAHGRWLPLGVHGLRLRGQVGSLEGLCRPGGAPSPHHWPAAAHGARGRLSNAMDVTTTRPQSRASSARCNAKRPHSRALGRKRARGGYKSVKSSSVKCDT